jgi:formylglycine-generating enzyme required for sulfatase activity
MKKYNAVFPPSYIALRRLVRVGGLESDLHLLPPKEFAADTSELVQMLKKGHYGVELDAEAWDRIITWIDLNAPCHGSWGEFTRISGDQRQRRNALQKLYCGREVDGEEIVEVPQPPIEPVAPRPVPEVRFEPVKLTGWPFDAAEARRRQSAAEKPALRVDLDGGQALELVWIPPGSFVMGEARGDADEQPPCVVAIGDGFWMGRCEITNAQYALFDPAHDSRFEDRTSWIFSEEYLGWPVNGPKQPVVRVSWERAMAFCEWLSRKTGQRFTLPTEAQWEYACRAGTETPFWYGDANVDFSPLANMADWTIRNLAYEGWRPKSPDLVPRDARFNDGQLVTADIGSYAPNPWGLYDMHGNAAEWTRTAFKPYPYRDDDGCNTEDMPGEKVVRGGSWYDRPQRCRSSFRLSYPAYQRVYNVGFRVTCQPPAAAPAL